MKKKLPTFLVLCLCYFTVLAQQNNVGINTTTPDPSAALHVEATDKGMLIPRMTSIQRKNIVNAAIGLLVFDTDTEFFWYRENTGWVELGRHTWERNGNDIYYNQGKVGIAKANPQETLDVEGNVKADAFLGDGSQLTGIDVNDADADPMNELQTLSQIGNEVTLSHSGGSISVNDADADPGNELELPANPQAGDMTYYDGSAWQRLSSGTNGQVLTMGGGAPGWTMPSNGDLSSLLQVTLPDGATLYVYPTDNSTGIPWGDNALDISVLPNITLTSEANMDYNGEFNTQAIVGHQGNYNNGVYAAKLCAEWQAFGFDDWYLPSAGELNAMYQQLGPTDNGYGGSGNMPTGFYWSSSEGDEFNAWVQYFVVGDQGFGVKDSSGFRCRCVRR